MKFRHHLTFISIALAALTTTAANKSADIQESNISKWFLESLEGKSELPRPTDMKLKPNQVATTEAQVWSAWKQANKEFDEQKLPDLRPLAQSDTNIWNIPANLEPDAVMSYFYGTKGESKPEAGYPLFLYIHGSGEPEREWATGLKICSNFDDAPSLYFIPRIPNAGDYYRWWQKGKQWSWEKLLRQSLASDNVDPNRIYFFGISEGGYGSQRLASFYADYLAAAGPMAGGEPLKNAPAENCRNISFSLRTGDEDYGFYRDKLTRYTKAAFDSLQQLHPEAYDHWIELIPGRGHHIDYAPTTPWLKTHTRNPYPKNVSWEDFDMDGIHRTGFYNLQVIQRPTANAGDRTRYEMSIDGNVVNISVDEVEYTTTETDSRWGIALKFDRSYKAATSGVFKIYFNSQLVDLNKPVTINVNGKRFFKGKLQLTLDNLIESCVEYGDPMRLYPASVTVDLSKSK